MLQPIGFLLLLVITSAHSAPTVCDDRALAAVSNTVVDVLVNQTHLISDIAHFIDEVYPLHSFHYTSFEFRSRLKDTVRDFGDIVDKALAAGVSSDHLKSLNLSLLIDDLQRLESKNRSLYGDMIVNLQQVQHQLEHAPNVTANCTERWSQTNKVLRYTAFEMSDNLWHYFLNIDLDFATSPSLPLDKELAMVGKYVTLVVDFNQHFAGMTLEQHDKAFIKFAYALLERSVEKIDHILKIKETDLLKQYKLSLTGSIQLLKKVYASI